MSQLVKGSFLRAEQAQQARKLLEAAGFSPDRIEQHSVGPEASTLPDSTAEADVSGLQSFVASLTGDPAQATFVPEEPATQATGRIELRMRVSTTAEAEQAEAVLRQAGAENSTRQGVG